MKEDANCVVPQSSKSWDTAGSRPAVLAIQPSRPLLSTADDLRCTINRVDNLSERVKGLLYGFNPSCDEPSSNPESLDDIITRSLHVAEQTEKTLHGIISRLNND